MNRILFLSTFFLLAIISCRKDEKFVPERPQTYQDFIGKYLIADSVVTKFSNNIIQKEILGEGKGLDVQFKPDGTTEVYFASGYVNKAAYLLKNDTLYGWQAHASSNAFPSPFGVFKLTMPEKDRLVISDNRFPDKSKKFYYHIKTSGEVMPKPLTGNFASFIGKTLFCDSMVITEGDFSRQIWKYGAGKGEDIIFHTTDFVGAPGQSPTSGKRYEFKAADTLYQWSASMPRYPNDFILVKTPTDKKLNTIERIGAKTKENYYTVAQ